MFYIEKCLYKDCTRTGNVALKENAEYCNLHAEEKKNGKKVNKDEDEENEE